MVVVLTHLFMAIDRFGSNIFMAISSNIFMAISSNIFMAPATGSNIFMAIGLYRVALGLSYEKQHNSLFTIHYSESSE